MIVSFAITGLAPHASAQSDDVASLRVATLVVGPDSDRVRVSLGAAELPAITLDPTTLPPQSVAAVTSDAELARRIAGARRAYLEGDPAGCLESLGEGEVDSLLAERRRAEAARVLTWRVACELAAMHAERARSLARELATYGLDPPAELDGPISPDVAELLVSEMDAVRAAPLGRLLIEGEGPDVQGHARARLDGSRSTCELPCAFEAPVGDHVVWISSDGFEPDLHRVRLSADGATLVFRAERAAPLTASAQWNAHYRGTPGVESATSLLLLATALRRPHLAVLLTERRGEQLHVRASFIDGDTLERRSSVLAGQAELDAAVGRLLADLLIAHLPAPAPPFYEEPAFYIVAGVALLSLIGGIVAATQIRVENPTLVRFVP